MKYTNENFTKDVQKIILFLASLHPDWNPDGKWEKSEVISEEIMKDIKIISASVYRYIEKLEAAPWQKKN